MPSAEEIYRQEIETYSRELPRLLQEGHGGRYAILKGDVVLSIWDTQRDALQAAREKFGLDPVAVKEIDPLDVERIARLNNSRMEKACPA